MAKNFFRSHSSAIRSLSFVICSLIGVSIWLQILATRPNRPWFPDDRFAEIWSFSLGKWGLSHNPMLMGESISYHWFSFAWVGLLSNLTTVNIETSLALFAPVIVAVGCAVLGFSIVRSFVQNSLLAVSAIAVAFVVDTERFFRGFGFHAFQLSSFSQFFSLCLGLGVTLIVLKISLQNSLRNLILIALMLFGLIGSKISSAASLLCGLICVFVYQIFANKKSLRNSLVSVAVIIIVAILSFAFFLGNPGNRSASVIRRPGWTVGNIGDLIHVYNSSLLRYLPILIFLTLALGGLGFLTLFNVRNLSAKFGTQRVVGVYIIGCYMASLAQMWIAQADGRNTVIADADNTLYAFQFVSTISVIVGIAYTFAVFENSLFGKISKRLVLVFLLLTLSTVSLSRHWVIEYSGAYATPFLTSLRPALPFFIVLFLGVLFYYVLRSSKRFEFSKFIAVFSIGSLTIGGLYISAANYVSVASRQQAEWRSVDRFNEVRPEIVSAVGWLKKHSGQSEIIAMKGERRSIADLAYRRDFAGFPITIRLNGLNSNLENIKRDAINNFAKSGSCDSTQFLKNYGATLFLINITNSETPDMKRCADEVFRNKTIVIYSFNLS